MIEIIINTKSPNKTVKYIKNINVNIYNIKYQKDSIIIKVLEKDLKKINKYYNYEIKKVYGIKKIFLNIKNKKISTLYLIIVLTFIIFFNNIIVDIEVITEDAFLKSHILNELDKNGLTKYMFKKNSKKLESIKTNLKNNNKNLIEWINIEEKGMKYIINIEQKITKKKNSIESYCNVVSKKDAIITKIITHKGMEIKDINDSVQKDEIIISGDIIYNEEVKKQVCASGKIYGKTWYTINISVPNTYEKIKKQDKNRYNILIKHNNKTYQIFKSRIINPIKESKKILNIFGYELIIQKEISTTRSIEKYTDEELTLLFEEKINEAMNASIKNEHNIIDKKVLKKAINNSKIELEVFIVVEE